MADNPLPDPAAGLAPSENPPPTPTPEAPPPPPAAPPATKIVVEGSKTEREIDLERRLEAEAAARRKAETDASYYADEARRLKELQSQVPTAKHKQKRVAVGFWEVEEE
jgi:hypothetical protein